MLGKRNPQIYGKLSMEQIMVELQRQWPDVHFTYLQSNHEGDLIDWIQRYGNAPDCTGILLNAGGYAHTSVALRDAVECSTQPVVEIHISDIYHRETFRRNSLLTEVCTHAIIGHGTDGYKEGTAWINAHTYSGQ